MRGGQRGSEEEEKGTSRIESRDPRAIPPAFPAVKEALHCGVVSSIARMVPRRVQAHGEVQQARRADPSCACVLRAVPLTAVIPVSAVTMMPSYESRAESVSRRANTAPGKMRRLFFGPEKPLERRGLSPRLLVDDGIARLQQALHAIYLVAHLLPLGLGLVVVEVLLHQGVVLSGPSTPRARRARFGLAHACSRAAGTGPRPGPSALRVTPSLARTTLPLAPRRARHSPGACLCFGCRTRVALLERADGIAEPLLRVMPAALSVLVAAISPRGPHVDSTWHDPVLRGLAPFTVVGPPLPPRRSPREGPSLVQPSGHHVGEKDSRGCRPHRARRGASVPSPRCPPSAARSGGP